MVTIIDSDNNQTVSTRYLDENHTGVFIQSKFLSSILSKVLNINYKGIDKINSGRNPYGLKTNFFKTHQLSANKKKDNDIKVYGLLDGKRTSRYISDIKYIKRNKEWISKYKVSFPYAFGDGTFGEIIPNPFVSYPGEVTTET